MTLLKMPASCKECPLYELCWNPGNGSPECTEVWQNLGSMADTAALGLADHEITLLSDCVECLRKSGGCQFGYNSESCKKKREMMGVKEKP